MKNLKIAALASTLIGAALFMAAETASAMPFGNAAQALGATAYQGEPSIIDVQYRRRGGDRGGRRGGGDWDRGAAGAAAAGAVIGIIGGIMAEEAARQSEAAEAADDDAVRSCMRRYRSYDPETQTFVGRDGLRHSCP